MRLEREFLRPEADKSRVCLVRRAQGDGEQMEKGQQADNRQQDQSRIGAGQEDFRPGDLR